LLATYIKNGKKKTGNNAFQNKILTGGKE